MVRLFLIVASAISVVISVGFCLLSALMISRGFFDVLHPAGLVYVISTVGIPLASVMPWVLRKTIYTMNIYLGNLLISIPFIWGTLSLLLVLELR